MRVRSPSPARPRLPAPRAAARSQPTRWPCPAQHLLLVAAEARSPRSDAPANPAPSHAATTLRPSSRRPPALAKVPPSAASPPCAASAPPRPLSVRLSRPAPVPLRSHPTVRAAPPAATAARPPRTVRGWLSRPAFRGAAYRAPAPRPRPAPMAPRARPSCAAAAAPAARARRQRPARAPLRGHTAA